MDQGSPVAFFEITLMMHGGREIQAGKETIPHWDRADIDWSRPGYRVS